MKKLLLSILIFISVVCARAVPFTFLEVKGGLTDSISISTPKFSSSQNLYVGVSELKVGDSFGYGYCIDFYNYANYSKQEYLQTTLANAPLTSLNYPIIGQETALNIVKILSSHYYSSLTNNQEAAAVQIAIWKEMAAGVGGVVTAKKYEQEANSIFLSSRAYQGELLYLNTFCNKDYQDFVTVPDNRDGMFLLLFLAVIIGGAIYLNDQDKYLP